MTYLYLWQHKSFRFSLTPSFLCSHLLELKEQSYRTLCRWISQNKPLDIYQTQFPVTNSTMVPLLVVFVFSVTTNIWRWNAVVVPASTQLEDGELETHCVGCNVTRTLNNLLTPFAFCSLDNLNFFQQFNIFSTFVHEEQQRWLCEDRNGKATVKLH